MTLTHIQILNSERYFNKHTKFCHFLFIEIFNVNKKSHIFFFYLLNFALPIKYNKIIVIGILNCNYCLSIYTIKVFSVCRFSWKISEEFTVREELMSQAFICQILSCVH